MHAVAGIAPVAVAEPNVADPNAIVAKTTQRVE